jgi:hypothetical protein
MSRTVDTRMGFSVNPTRPTASIDPWLGSLFRRRPAHSSRATRSRTW